MITVCPQCTQHLNVTAADLRRGHGNVRCGRCSAVFNGLVTLIEESSEPADKRRKSRQAKRTRTGSARVPRPAKPGPAPGAGAVATPAGDAPAPAVTQDPADDLPVLQMAELDARLAALVQRFQSVQAGSDATSLPQGAPDTPALPADTSPPAAPQPDPEPTVATPAQSPPPVASAPEPLAEPEPLPEPEPSPEPLPKAEPPPEIILLTGEPRATSRLWWGVVGVLVLLLLAQVGHAFRRDLAQGDLAGPYGLVYGWFGGDPLLQADPGDYEVRQLGAVAGLAQVGGASRVRVRASVHNPGTQPLPLPWLRARLTDRYGTVLQQNDLAPGDYLEGPVPAELQPDQRIDAALILPDPGRDASGFELDACLPGLGGRLHCSATPQQR